MPTSFHIQRNSIFDDYRKRPTTKAKQSKSNLQISFRIQNKVQHLRCVCFCICSLAKVYPSTSVCQSRYFLTLYLSLLVPVFLCFYPKNWSFTLLSIWNVLFGLILSWFCSHSTYLPNYLPTYLGTSFFSKWLRYLTSIFLSHSAYTFIYIHLPTYRYTKT